MSKRLTRSDYLFVITFIFMLVAALGAFFFGLKLGQERTTAKYEAAINKQKADAGGLEAYHQQYLVTFYHTIYQPYREFNKMWFEKMDELQMGRSSDAMLILKDLAKLAQETYDNIGAKTMPDSSPLLQDAHQDYMRSLKLFSEGLNDFSSKANSLSGNQLISQLDKDSYLGEAKKFALKAEKEYYDSIIKWNQTVNPQLNPIDVTKPLALNDWSKLPLNVKNDYSAQILVSAQWFKAFTPQDLTSRIDEMTASGQASKMKLNDVQQVVDVLMATDAVRPGDFLRNKNKWYANETLPQLPFFTN